MASLSRNSLLAKMHRVLKKHFKPFPLVHRSVLEQLLFACCLENSPFDKAEKGFSVLKENYYDWNEVRVSSVRELAESLSVLPLPAAAATSLKRMLQAIFEMTYSFDLDQLKKQNLGQAVNKLKAFDGITPFVVAYATYATLGGHAIPIDKNLFDTFYLLGIVALEDKGPAVPGLERAISKSKGSEFFSLAHQFSAELAAAPQNAALQKVLLEINTDSKERFPKRGQKTLRPPAPEPKPAPAKGEAASAKGAAKKGKTPAPTPATPPKKSGKASPAPVEAKRPHAPKVLPTKSATARKSATSRLGKQKPR